MTIKAVEEAIEHVKAQMARYDRYDDYYWSYNETSTRYILIDPVLWALGWNIYDMRQCAVEWPMPFYPRKPIGRADYVLGNVLNENVIVIEAKSIKVPIGGKRTGFENKLAAYTRGLTKGRAVLTNGLVWHIYELGSSRRPLNKRHLITANINNETITDGKGQRPASFHQMAAVLNRHLNRRCWWNPPARE